MVLAEALASGTAILAAASGAIGEVVGDQGKLFEPGDWHGLAQGLLDGPLAGSPAARVEHDPGRVEIFSTSAAAQRIGGVYDRLLGRPVPA